MILFSVVIPVYNKVHCIGATLRSVLNQSYPSLEAIVIDDGSTDDSARSVAQVHDPRLRLIRQANQGVARARNAGIDAARGDMVCFLDADDLWHPDFLASVAVMARAHPQRAFFSTGYRLVYEGDPARALRDAPATGEAREVPDFYRQWRRDAFLCTNTVAIRRAALLAVQPCFAPGESLAEDQDLWFRLVEKHGLIHLPRPLAAYRRNLPSSLSTIELQRHGDTGLLPAFLRLEQRALRGEVPSEQRADALRFVADKRVNLARYLLVRGQRRRAMGVLFAGSHGPTLRRWWLTLAVCLVGQPSWLLAWDRQRQRSRLASRAYGESA